MVFADVSSLSSKAASSLQLSHPRSETKTCGSIFQTNVDVVQNNKCVYLIYSHELVVFVNNGRAWNHYAFFFCHSLCILLNAQLKQKWKEVQQTSCLPTLLLTIVLHQQQQPSLDMFLFCSSEILYHWQWQPREVCYSP